MSILGFVHASHLHKACALYDTVVFRGFYSEALPDFSISWRKAERSTFLTETSAEVDEEVVRVGSC